jgi:hypothetical protein
MISMVLRIITSLPQFLKQLKIKLPGGSNICINKYIRYIYILINYLFRGKGNLLITIDFEVIG